MKDKKEKIIVYMSAALKKKIKAKAKAVHRSESSYVLIILEKELLKGKK